MVEIVGEVCLIVRTDRLSVSLSQPLICTVRLDTDRLLEILDVDSLVFKPCSNADCLPETPRLIRIDTEVKFIISLIIHRDDSFDVLFPISSAFRFQHREAFVNSVLDVFVRILRS